MTRLILLTAAGTTREHDAQLTVRETHRASHVVIVADGVELGEFEVIPR